MPVPQRIVDLVERFAEFANAFKSGDYKEEPTRHEFIDPLLMELGWDVNNEQGTPEPYKEVIHEDAIKIGGYTKAPDYCLRIGGVRKAFIEAKKPSVNLRDDVSAAFQVRRYAWSANLPLSILTDFEELAIYDCRIKPEKSDPASTARVLYLNYTQYVSRWDEIESLFSRQAVLEGSLDEYAEALKAHKGVATVDAAFLKEIESWREMLARVIATKNPALSQRDLNFAVQVTIDRIIFLRICEDRGIEPYGRLQALQNGANIYERLCHLFREADDRYNSGLFHFRQERGRLDPPDDLTTSGSCRKWMAITVAMRDTVRGKEDDDGNPTERSPTRVDRSRAGSPCTDHARE